MKPYERRVFYYETDKMGIVHHSNYIRWMEEARLYLMRRSGANYEAMEREGIIMPVTSVGCEYKISAHYDQTVYIFTRLSAYNGVRAQYSYELKSADGCLLAVGESGHCFLDGETRRPVNLKRRLPQYSAFFEQLLADQEENEHL